MCIDTVSVPNVSRYGDISIYRCISSACVYVCVCVCVMYGTAQLQLHFTRVVPCSILHVKSQSLPWKSIFPRDETWHCHDMRHGIYTRLTWHVAFTCDGIMTFAHDVVVLTMLNNQQDSSCL